MNAPFAFELPETVADGSPLVPELPPAVAAGHPMDSSRILMAMTAMARRAVEADTGNEIDSIVPKAVLKTLLSAMHFRDVRLLKHSRQVALLTVGMAQQLGWDSRPLRILETAAILHDIAKIGIPDSILRKPGKLSAQEADFIARHHDIACNLLQAFRVDHEAISLILQSHGYFNGSLDGSTGVGTEMTQGARILSVADAYESLTTDQPFRAAMSHFDAMKVLRESSGSRFDGNVVSALDRWAGGAGLNYLMDQADAVIPVAEAAAISPVAAAEAGTLCHIFSYLHVLETLYGGFYVLDSDLRFVVWSGGAESVLGRPAGEMLGQPYSRELLAHADAEGRPLSESDCPVRQAVTTGQSACRSVKIRDAAGEWMSVELQSIPLFDGSGKLTGVAQIFSGVEGEEQDSKYRDLKEAASRDPLTGIANRGQLEARVSAMFDSYEDGDRSGEGVFSVMFVDIDHFKAINDTYGHAAGDRVLIKVAEMLTGELYSGEFVARYGGEEFVVLCPGTTQAEAKAKAERLRKAAAALRFDEPKLKLTASFGVSEVRSGDGPDQLLGRADAALFAAKRGGRNRVEEHGDTPEEKTKPDYCESPLVFRQQMEACTQSDLIVYKLTGFIEELKADLREVTESHVLVWMGQGRMWGKWGPTHDEQPIEVRVDIGSMRDGKGAAKYVPIDVLITPRGRGFNAEQFQDRAKRMSEKLRSHLVAR